jgi:hypothetical protein
MTWARNSPAFDFKRLDPDPAFAQSTAYHARPMQRDYTMLVRGVGEDEALERPLGTPQIEPGNDE